MPKSPPCPCGCTENPNQFGIYELCTAAELEYERREEQAILQEYSAIASAIILEETRTLTPQDSDIPF